MSAVCLWDKPCKDKDEHGLCIFEGTCNQKGYPYMINDKLVFLRKSDLWLKNHPLTINGAKKT